MNYLLEAIQHLGIWYTPQRILALRYGDGKTQNAIAEPALVRGGCCTIGTPPFAAGIEPRKDTGGCIRDVVNDYAEAMAVGDLSGAELA
jgi:hypothetical protein